jgi:CDP-glycerol glycerophosphotransferase (TagB/SpsB family)
VHSCNKLYNRAFIIKQGLRFPEHTIKEDVDFTRRAYFEAASVTIVPAIVYCYRGRGNSAIPSDTKRKDMAYIGGIIDTFGHLHQYYLQHGLTGYWPYSLSQGLEMILGRALKCLRECTPDERIHLLGRISEFVKPVSIDHLWNLSSREKAFVLLIKAGFIPEAADLANPRADLSRLVRSLAATGDADSVLIQAVEELQTTHTRLQQRLMVLVRFLDENRISHAMRRAFTRVFLKGRERHRRSGIWLVGERLGQSAQDTGYHFFRYCRKTNPHHGVYYVLRRASRDSHRVLPLGNVLAYGSLKHLRLAVKADALIFNNTIADLVPKPLHKLALFRNKKTVFLQHGITAIKSIHGNYNKNRYPYIDRVVTASNDEKEIFIKKMRFMDQEVMVTGFSRFDNLWPPHRPEPKRILVAPSWRHWLGDKRDFVGSAFYVHYQRLLNCADLAAALKAQGAALDFYLHFNLQPHAQHFSTIYGGTINIVDPVRTPLHTLIKSAHMAVSDYSSIVFDIVYQDKPAILYHFDLDQWLASRWGPGYYDYEKELPFDIALQHEDLIELISHYLDNGCQMTSVHQQRSGRFFAFRDNRNCERIYNGVKTLIKS